MSIDKKCIIKRGRITSFYLLLGVCTLTNLYGFHESEITPAQMIIGKVPAKALYDSWKKVLSSVEKSPTLAHEHPTIKKYFENLYTGSLTYRFERLAHESFDDVFLPQQQALFFTFIEDFDTRVRRYLEGNSISLSHEDKRILFHILDLNESFLAKKAAIPPDTTLQRFLNNKWGQVTLFLGGSATLMAVLWAALWKKGSSFRDGNDHSLSESDKQLASSPVPEHGAQKPLKLFIKGVRARQVVSPRQKGAECGYYAALNALCMVMKPESNDLSSLQKDYTDFVKEQMQAVKKKRIEAFESTWKNIFIKEQHQELHTTYPWHKFIATEGVSAYHRNLTPEKILKNMGFQRQGFRDYLPTPLAKKDTITTIIEDYIEDTDKDGGGVLFFNPNTQETLTEATYEAWSKVSENRIRFFLTRALMSSKLGQAGDYILNHFQDLSKNQNTFDQPHKAHLVYLCDHNWLGSQEIATIIMPALKEKFVDKSNCIIDIEEPSQLDKNASTGNIRGIMITNQTIVEKIKEYRISQSPIGIILNVGGNHWTAVLMTYDKKGMPLIKAADSLGGNYLKSGRSIMEKIITMFTEDDVLDKLFADTLEDSISSAELLSESSAQHLCKAIIKALYGYQGNGEPKSYFEQCKTHATFQAYVKRLEGVYAKIKEKLTARKQSVVTLSLSTKSSILSDDSHTTKKGPLELLDMSSDADNLSRVDIAIDLTTCPTFHDLVTLLKENAKIKALIAGDENWHTR